MPAYPKYEEVINQFFTRYSTLEVAEDEQFSFAKKTNGWHAMVRKFNSNEVIKDELFWSRSDKEYLEIKFPFYVQALTDPNHEQMLNDSWAKLSSSLVPYWGYNGWEKDVFNEFGNKKKLSDSLLNGLARAYSSYARSLISRSEFGKNNLYDKLPKGQNALSSSLLEEYLKYQHLSIAAYHKLSLVSGCCIY